MDDISGVQIVDSKTYVDEHLPDEVGRKWAAILFLDASAQVAVLAVLHDDVDAGAIDE